MNSFIGIFYCCKEVNYSKEIDINSNKPKEEEMNINEKKTKKNLNNDKIMKNIYKSVNNINNININGINFLLDQSNPELYNNIIKNNLTLGVGQKNISKQNLNIFNYNQTQKLSENDYYIGNNIINNNIIKMGSNNNYLGPKQSSLKNTSLIKSNISTKKLGKPKQLILSGELFFNKKLKITSNGLENYKRNNNNIFPIYFGIENINDNNDAAYNDFVLNFSPKINSQTMINNNNSIKNKINNSGKSGRIFKIFYDKNNDFYLSFMHSSFILYYRINNLVYLEYDKEYYLILGNVFMSILIQKNGDKNKVMVKVEMENHKPEKNTFENEQKIKIGREADNDIEINIQCISKYHGALEYNFDKKLYFYKDNNSTNGSTLLIKEDDTIPLIGLMNFKLENISFMIKESDLEK